MVRSFLDGPYLWDQNVNMNDKDVLFHIRDGKVVKMTSNESNHYKRKESHYDTYDLVFSLSLEKNDILVKLFHQKFTYLLKDSEIHTISEMLKDKDKIYKTIFAELI